MTTEKKSSRGRPLTYTPEIAQEIFERLSVGEPLEVICRDAGMPASRTVYDWCIAGRVPGIPEDFAADIAQARNFGHDAIACRLRETARGIGESTGDVQRDKLIIETDLKLLAKWSKKYGDRTIVQGDDEAPPIRVQHSIAQADRAIIDRYIADNRSRTDG